MNTRQKSIKRYPGRMTQKEILKLFREGIYRADLDSGIIYNQKGIPLTQQILNPEGHAWVQLYYNGKRRGIAVHRLIWMVGSKRAIPEGFEVHHADLDTSNNCYGNLYCLFHKDHSKAHDSGFLIQQDALDFFEGKMKSNGTRF